MKISTRLRYGTRMLVKLGHHYGKGPVYLKDIAKTEAISAKYLSQIIIPLKNSGLVNSFRGANGGYVLSRPPAMITMKEIYTILEGDFNIVKCVGDPRACSRIPVCTTHDLWTRLGAHIGNMLECISLADLITQSPYSRQNAIIYNI